MKLNMILDFWLPMSVSLLIMGVFSMLKIPDRKPRKRKKVDIQRLLESCDEPIYIASPDGSITGLNRSASERLGYTPKELSRLRVSDIDPNINIHNWEDIWNAVRTNKILRLEVIHVSKKGNRLPTEVLATHHKNGDEEFCICYAKDIKDEKYIEGKLTWVRRSDEEFNKKISLWEQELSFADEKLKNANENLLMISEKLQQSQKRINNFIEATSDIVWIGTANGEMDPDMKLPYWEQYTGQLFEQSLGEGWRKMVHPDDLERVSSHWDLIIAQKKIERIQYRLKRADGQWRWIDAKAVPCLNETGQIKEWIGTLTDIHDQKVAEEKAKNDELQFSAIINSTDDVIFSINPDFTVRCANTALYDYARKEFGVEIVFGQTSIFDINPKERFEKQKEAYLRVLQGESITEIINIQTSEAKPVIYYESTRKPIFSEDGRVIGISSFNKNITKEVEYKRIATKRESQFLAIINSSEDIIISLNKDLTINATNHLFIERAKNGYNVTIEEGKTSIFEVIPSWLHAEYKEHYAKAFAGEYVKNETFRTYPGKELPDAYLEEYINPIFDENNEVSGISVFSKNVTDKKELIRKISETEAKLTSIVGSSDDSVWSIDTEFRLTYFNPYMEYITSTGFGIQLVLGESIIKLFAEKGFTELSEKFKRRYERVLAGENFVEVDHYLLGDNESYLESKLYPVYRDETIIGVSVFYRNVTARVMAEVRVQENEQFLSVSQQIAKLGSWRLDLKKREMKWSRQLYEIFDVSSYQKLSYEFFTKLIGEKGTAAMQKSTEQAVKTKTPTPFEFDYTTTGNEEKYFLGYLHPSFNEVGELTELSGTIQDITDKVKIEKELAKQNSLLDGIIENVPFELWARDLNQQIILQNKACEDRWGDMLGKSIDTTLGIEDNVTNKWIENNQRAYNGNIVSQETTYFSKGVEFSFHEIIAPLLENGRIIGIVGVNIDITKRVVAEQAIKEALEEEQKLNETLSQREEELTAKEEELRQSLEELIRINEFVSTREKQISAIFDNTPDLIFSIDTNYNVTTANKPSRAVYRLLAEKELKMGASIFDIIRPHLKDEYKALYDTVLSGQQVNRVNTVDNEKIRKSIHEEYYSPIKDEDDNIIGIAAFSKNVTQKLEAEARVKENEIMLSALINSTTDYILLLDTDLRIKLLNEAIDKRYREVFGINVIKGVTKAIDTLPEYLHEKYNDMLGRALRGESVVENITRVYSNGLPTLHTEEFFFPVFDESSKVIAISVFLRDITSRKSAELQLKENEFRFRLISKVSNDALWEYDIVSSNILWAAGYDKIFGLPIDTQYSIEMWESSIYESDRSRVLDKFSDALLNKSANEWEDEYRIITSDGKIKHVHDVGQIIRDDDGNAIKMVGGMKDISELKEKQLELEDALDNERKLNEALSQREEELTAKEEELRQSIEELSSVNEFISQREKQISDIFDNTPDIIVSLDTHLNITAANKTYTDIYRKLWNKDFQVGSNMVDQLPPDNRSKYKELYFRVLAGEKINQVVESEEEVFGKYVSDEYYGPIKNEHGEVTGIAIFIKDVTEKTRTEALIRENELQLSAIINSTTDAIFSINPDFTIRTANKSLIYFAKRDFGVDVIFGKTSIFDINTEERKPFLATLYNKVLQGENIAEEYVINLTDPNSAVYIESTRNPILDSNNQIIGIAVFNKDITKLKTQQEAIERALEEERKLNEILAQREAELLVSEEVLKKTVAELSDAYKVISAKESQISSIIENTTDLISSIDTDFKLVTFNNAYKKFVKSNNRINCYEGLDVFTTIRKEEQAAYRNTFQRVLYGESFIQQKKVTTIYGEIIYLEEFYNPIRNHTEEIIGISLFVRDTTEKSIMYEKLEESERMLEIAQEVAKLGSWSLNLLNWEIKWSEQTYKIFDVPKGTPMNAEKYNEILGDEMAASFRGDFEIYKSKNQPYTREFEYTTPKKVTKYIFVIGMPVFDKDKNLTGYYGSVQDITERKKIEERLSKTLRETQKLNEVLEQREEELRTYVDELSLANRIIIDSETNLRAIINNSDFGIWAVDREYKLIAYNDVYNNYYLRDNSIEPFKGMSVLDKMSKSEMDIWRPMFERTFKGERQSMELAVEDSVFEIFFNPITDIYNKNLGAAVFTQNITNRKVIENQIKDSENFLNSIIENIPIGLIVMDEKANILKMNSEHRKNYGIPETKVMRHTFDFFEDGRQPNSQFDEVIKKAYSGEIVLYEEIYFDFGAVSAGSWTTRKDQGWFAVTVFPIKENNDIKSIIIVSREITLEKQNQLRIRQSTDELIESNKKMAEYRLMALRSAMNPHFLFNSLNSIQYFIAKNEREQALNYLSLFSKLIRSILNSSVANSNTLSDEINILKFYIDLETLRFDNKFSTYIHIDEDIDADNIEIPSLILQPYVENAILHGLCNKDGNSGILRINLKMHKNGQLLCIIEDNGIGREEAKEIKKANKLHKSVGMLVTQERLELINRDNNLSVEITDLYKEGKPAGTKVEVYINI